ncbi:hypothetical protein DPX16_2762 [Anabarilius grahami]|uniref:Uncharacterized protein n=1 Tax=Anabarilius grahami TaxID=495550 RepID=A0A3N0XQG0_ANAGA|nr:hypothetical protein DPX16_2331 [Anabarilius grahami]ROJ35248.1 hypothetical protein DPX16_2762 [Anabarilius grahami]
MISTTTNTTPTPETETSTSTTEPPKVTRIDTLQLKTEISETTTEDHPDCCLTVTNTRTDEDIVDYHIQDSSLCPIRAIHNCGEQHNLLFSGRRLGPGVHTEPEQKKNIYRHTSAGRVIRGGETHIRN